MFEKTLFELSAKPWIDTIDAKLADQYGVDGIHEGWLPLNAHDAIKIIQQLDRVIKTVVYIRNQKRLRSLRNQIVLAFGPQIEEFLNHNES